MKLLASLAFGTATMVAASFGLVQPAMAGDDDVSIGIKLGPLCVGICIDGGGSDRRRNHSYRDDNAYYDDGFYADRGDTYHQRYDRRDTYEDYAENRDDGYAGYRRHHQQRRHHDDRDDE